MFDTPTSIDLDKAIKKYILNRIVQIHHVHFEDTHKTFSV